MHPAGAGFVERPPRTLQEKHPHSGQEGCCRCGFLEYLRKTLGESGLGRVNSKKPAIEEDTYAVLRITGQDARAAADPLATWRWHDGGWKEGTWQDGVFVPFQ